MEHKKFTRFLRFLRQEIAIPAADLRLALQHPEHAPSLLPMILWQYGFVSLSQLNQIFDWMEQSRSGEGKIQLPNESEQLPLRFDFMVDFGHKSRRV